MPIPYTLVNAFSATVTGGNPAAVLVLPEGHDPDDGWYQTVAAQLSQPATAFCRPIPGGYHLRWFTPVREVPLCGHGTLAAAHVLYETGTVAADVVIACETAGGMLTVRHRDGLCWVSLPSTPLAESPVPAAVLDALRLDQVEWFGSGGDDFVVVVDSPDVVEKVGPDVELLRALPTMRTIVTAEGPAGTDIVSRVFTPGIGFLEDQVTGSAHAALGPYWAARLGRPLLTARQASARGGDLVLDLSIDGIVQVGGQALTFGRGELLV